MGKSKSDIDVLAKGLDGTNLQRAEALGVFVDGRIAAALKGLREELSGLTVSQKENIEAARVDGSPEAVQAANEGSQAVNEAKAAVKTAEVDPTPEKVEEAGGKVEKAKMAVAETESTLAGMVERHEAILAPWRVGETQGSRPKSRFNDIEDELVGIRGRVDQCMSASAEALAIAASRGPALWIVAVVTFTVALAVTGVVATFTDLEFFWGSVLVSAVTAVFVTVCTWILDWATPADSGGFARAQAQATRRPSADNGAVPGFEDHPDVIAEADAAADAIMAHAEASATRIRAMAQASVVDR